MSTSLFGYTTPFDEISEELKQLMSGFTSCNFEQWVTKVQGLSVNSSSPTDIWFITFAHEFKGVAKLYPSKQIVNMYASESVSFIQSLDYERRIYQLTKERFIDTGVLPFHFLEPLGQSDACDIVKLGKILEKGGLDNSTHRVALNMAGILASLNHLKYKDIVNDDNPLPEEIADLYIQRDNISTPNIQQMYTRYYSLVNRYRYIRAEKSISFIITRDEEPDGTVSDLLFTPGISESIPLDHIWGVIFQIAVACYAMSLAKIVHNDLHVKNIFYKRIINPSDQIMTFVLNEFMYTIVCPYRIIVFDYDRAYTPVLGPNPYLINEIMRKYSQRNVFIDNLDMLKVFGFFTRKEDTQKTREMLLRACAKTRRGYDILKEAWSVGSFLQMSDGSPIPSAMYQTEFRSPEDIVLIIGCFARISEIVSRRIVGVVNAKDFSPETGDFIGSRKNEDLYIWAANQSEPPPVEFCKSIHSQMREYLEKLERENAIAAANASFIVGVADVDDGANDAEEMISSMRPEIDPEVAAEMEFAEQLDYTEIPLQANVDFVKRMREKFVIVPSRGAGLRQRLSVAAARDFYLKRAREERED